MVVIIIYLHTDLPLTADWTGAERAPGTLSHILQLAVVPTTVQPTEVTSFSILLQKETEHAERRVRCWVEVCKLAGSFSQKPCGRQIIPKLQGAGDANLDKLWSLWSNSYRIRIMSCLLAYHRYFICFSCSHCISKSIKEILILQTESIIQSDVYSKHTTSCVP